MGLILERRLDYQCSNPLSSMSWETNLARINSPVCSYEFQMYPSHKTSAAAKGQTTTKDQRGTIFSQYGSCNEESDGLLLLCTSAWNVNEKGTGYIHMEKNVILKLLTARHNRHMSCVWVCSSDERKNCAACVTCQILVVVLPYISSECVLTTLSPNLKSHLCVFRLKKSAGRWLLVMECMPHCNVSCKYGPWNVEARESLLWTKSGVCSCSLGLQSSS